MRISRWKSIYYVIRRQSGGREQGYWMAVETKAGIEGSKSLKEDTYCGLHPEDDGSYCYMRRLHCMRWETLQGDGLGFLLLLLFSRKDNGLNQERNSGWGEKQMDPEYVKTKVQRTWVGVADRGVNLDKLSLSRATGENGNNSLGQKEGTRSRGHGQRQQWTFTPKV